jgi:predicted RNase H-like HicB family nuclease
MQKIVEYVESLELADELSEDKQFGVHYVLGYYGNVTRINIFVLEDENDIYIDREDENYVLRYDEVTSVVDIPREETFKSEDEALKRLKELIEVEEDAS